MRYAIYARYSSDLQNPHSTEDQIRIIREHIHKLGGTVAGVYSDDAISGSFIMNRPGIQDLLVDARMGRFERVCAEALDRVSRDQEDVAAIFKRLNHCDIKITTIAEGDISELHIGLKGTMNALFIKDMAAKVRRGQRGRLEAGFAPAGICYGYKAIVEIDQRGEVVRGKRAILQEQALVVQRIFDEYACEKSARQIAADLNRDRIPSPRGGVWAASAINGNRKRKSGILYNEMYVGRMTYNRQNFRKNPDTGKRVPRLNGKADWHTVEVPDLRIISDEIWERVQRLKHEKGGEDRPELKRRPRHLFSGIIRCGVCGGGFTAGSAGRLRCFRHRESGEVACSNGHTITVETLEKDVLAGFEKRMLQTDAFEAFETEFRLQRGKLRANQEKEKSIRLRKISDYTKKIDRIINCIAEGTDNAQMRKQMQDMSGELAVLRDQARRDEGNAVDVIKFEPRVSTLYQKKVGELRAALDETLNDGSRRRASAISVLRCLIPEIRVFPGEKRGLVKLELHGCIPGILAYAAGETDPVKLRSVITVVAADGFEPPTKGL